MTKHNYSIYAAAAIMGLVALSSAFEAKARDFRLSVTNEVPVSTGIAPAPSAGRYYQGGARIMSRPSARIVHGVDGLGQTVEAPANGCEALTGGFRSLSGGDRGACYSQGAALRYK